MADFPATVFTDPVAAEAALMNRAGAAGLSALVARGPEAVRNGVLANLFDSMPTGAAAGRVLPSAPGAGISVGVGTLYKSAVVPKGTIIETQILMDLTGLASVATDLDIIGAPASITPANIGQITAAVNGTIIGGSMVCLEVPAGGAVDIDLYAATVGTGAYDDLVTDLTETVVVTSGGNWTLGRTLPIVADSVAANAYLYLTSGAATAGTFTAGRFLITLYGY